MLLVWLLVSRAGAEWVEISQQHYQKPIRTPGEPSRVFQQNLQKDLEYKPVKPYQDDYEFRKPLLDFTAQEKINPFVDREVRPANPFLHDSYHSTPLAIDSHIDREVKPVRVNPFLQDDHTLTKTALENFPPKPTRIRQVGDPKETYSNHTLTEHNWNLHKHRFDNKPGMNKPQAAIPTYDNWNENTYGLNNGGDNEEVTHKADVFIIRNKNDSVPGKIERVSNIGTVKRVELSNTPVKSPTQKYDNIDEDLDVKTNVFDSHNHSFSSQPNIEEVLKEVGFVNPKSSAPGDIEKTTHKENKINFSNSSNKPLHEFPAIRDTSQGFVNANNKTIKTVMIDGKNNIASDQKQNKNEKTNNKKDSSTEQGEDTSSSEIKLNTMENILKFMKVVAETITKNTRRGANGKIVYLNELKHSLLDNIKSRIDAAWPDEGARRRSRSARGHVEFPSSESALMTISFLTFAVFLIKLVLQVIQTYKHKTMVMAPLMVATAGRTIASKLRNKSDVDRL